MTPTKRARSKAAGDEEGEQDEQQARMQQQKVALSSAHAARPPPPGTYGAVDDTTIDPWFLYGGNVAAACQATNEVAGTSHQYSSKDEEQRSRKVAIEEEVNDEKVRQRAHSRLTAWQSRERKRIEFEVLQERQTELKSRKVQLQQQNNYLKQVIENLKASPGGASGIFETAMSQNRDFASSMLLPGQVSHTTGQQYSPTGGGTRVNSFSNDRRNGLQQQTTRTHNPNFPFQQDDRVGGLTIAASNQEPVTGQSIMSELVLGSSSNILEPNPLVRLPHLPPSAHQQALNTFASHRGGRGGMERGIMQDNSFFRGHQAEAMLGATDFVPLSRSHLTGAVERGFQVLYNQSSGDPRTTAMGRHQFPSGGTSAGTTSELLPGNPLFDYLLSEEKVDVPLFRMMNTGATAQSRRGSGAVPEAGELKESSLQSDENKRSRMDDTTAEHFYLRPNHS
jgi:hypothetical protein